MASLNNCNFIGNCAAAPETKVFGNGGKVANIRLAVTERYTDRNGDAQERTEWISVVFMGKLADTAERFVTKGSPLFVSGRLRTREWTDQSGNKRYSTEIVADNLQLLGKKPDGGRQGGGNGGVNFNDSF